MNERNRERKEEKENNDKMILMTKQEKNKYRTRAISADYNNDVTFMVC